MVADDALRRERRRLTGKIRREIRAREFRLENASEQLGVHKNSLYLLYRGEDFRVSTMQKLAHALGFKIALVESEDAPASLETKQFQCPKCGENVVSPPEDDSGRAECPVCKSHLRVKKVVRYVARLDKSRDEPDEDDGGEVR